MTLNIMAVSRSRVFLTGDFRLTNSSTKNYNDNFLVEKLIPVNFKEYWTALVSFTGIAEYNGINVSKWLIENLALLPRDVEFDALGRTLLRANEWFRKIPIRHRYLTMCAVGFVGKRPFAMLASNFQNIHGKYFEKASPELMLTEMRPKKPSVYILGDNTALSLEDTETIKKSLEKSKPDDMHNILYRLNLKASERSNLISPQCVTGHLMATGHSAFYPHGIPENISYKPSITQPFFNEEVIQAIRNSMTNEEDRKRYFDEHGKFLGRFIATTGARTQMSERALKGKGLGKKK